MSAVTTWHPSMGLPMPVEVLESLPVARPRSRRLGAVVITVIGSLALLAAGAWVTTSQIFAMRSLQVTGNVHLSDQQVASMAGLTDRTNVLWLSSSDVARRLEQNPWVLSAHVARTLPAGVTVEITERVPVAVLAGTRLIVAADGVVLGPASGVVRLPVIQGIVEPGPIRRVRGAPAGLAVAAAIPWPTRQDVREIAIAPDGQVTLSLASGVEVLYGDATSIGAKGAALQAVMEWASRNHLHPRTIDLHAPDAPAISESPPVTATTRG